MRQRPSSLFPQRSPLGVDVDVSGQDQDPFDEAPQRAEATGAQGHEDLGDAESTYLQECDVRRVLDILP